MGGIGTTAATKGKAGGPVVGRHVRLESMDKEHQPIVASLVEKMMSIQSRRRHCCIRVSQKTGESKTRIAYEGIPVSQVFSDLEDANLGTREMGSLRVTSIGKRGKSAKTTYSVTMKRAERLKEWRPGDPNPDFQDDWSLVFEPKSYKNTQEVSTGQKVLLIGARPRQLSNVAYRSKVKNRRILDQFARTFGYDSYWDRMGNIRLGDRPLTDPQAIEAMVYNILSEWKAGNLHLTLSDIVAGVFSGEITPEREALIYQAGLAVQEGMMRAATASPRITFK